MLLLLYSSWNMGHYAVLLVGSRCSCAIHTIVNISYLFTAVTSS